MAEVLVKESNHIIRENAQDLEYARDKGMSDAMIDRLTLNETAIKDMANGLVQIAALPDPVGEITGMRRRPKRACSSGREGSRSV